MIVTEILTHLDEKSMAPDLKMLLKLVSCTKVLSYVAAEKKTAVSNS